jgi:hypothetical protein
MPSKTRVCAKCGAGIYTPNKTGFCRPCFDAAQAAPIPAPVPVTPLPTDQIRADRDKAKSAAAHSDLQKKYAQALETIEQQESELGILAALKEGIDSTVVIEPHYGDGTSEATPVLVASDWHVEQLVTLAQTNGLNQSDLELADKKITKFWQSGLRLMRLLNQDVTIKDVVLGLLGDFIDGDIHEELVETALLSPTAAIIWVQDRIIAGLNFLLNNSTYTFTIVCRAGNHSRTTKKVHFSTENGHSLEHLMYVHLAGYFRSEPRLKFVIQEGYHIYVDVYDEVLRMHHGHALKYGGGIGGLFIPTYKAIGSWSQARPATCDVFGHFHQTKDGGSFLCNGSLVGWNSYALTIKAPFEPPRQSLFLIDKRRGRTATWPVLLT